MNKTALPYPVYFIKDIGPGLDTFIRSKKYSPVFLVCDSNTLHYCLPALVASCKSLQQGEIIELEPGEESKSIEVINNLWHTLTEREADKNSLVINLGGGVISDAGGFAASVFKRGIPYINIPTTLLAMADASVGGKTGINFSGIKNHIGTITQPRAVFIDTAFLQTLPVKHIINGWAEVLKIALVKDKKFFKEIAGKKLNQSFNDLRIIKRSVELKKEIVLKDPDEKNLRKILNFGHTVGHAVESLSLGSQEPLLHGEAVAIGMAIESILCFSLKRISKTELDQILSSLLVNFKFRAIKDMEGFLGYMAQDKKHEGKNLQFALLKGIGKCDPAVRVTVTQLKKAIALYHSEIKNVASV